MTLDSIATRGAARREPAGDVDRVGRPLHPSPICASAARPSSP
jgi:hypothetical protein